MRFGGSGNPLGEKVAILLRLRDNVSPGDRIQLWFSPYTLVPSRVTTAETSAEASGLAAAEASRQDFNLLCLSPRCVVTSGAQGAVASGTLAALQQQVPRTDTKAHETCRSVSCHSLNFLQTNQCCPTSRAAPDGSGPADVGLTSKTTAFLSKDGFTAENRFL